MRDASARADERRGRADFYKDIPKEVIVQILLTGALKTKLREKGVECYLAAEHATLPIDCTFEAPCSIKWMELQASLSIGAFSYAVSGYFFATRLGRYVSIGEQVQMGRGDHATDWLSTHPSFYLQQPLFDVGRDFNGSDDYATFMPETEGHAGFHGIRPITVGNDVWIGHGAFIKPGVTIGNGAIIGGHTVVTKDVPPYSIYVGNPGVVKRYRYPAPVIEALEALRWWRLAPWQLRGIDVSRIGDNLDALERRIAGTPPFEPTVLKLSDLI